MFEEEEEEGWDAEIPPGHLGGRLFNIALNSGAESSSAAYMSDTMVQDAAEEVTCTKLTLLAAIFEPRRLISHSEHSLPVSVVDSWRWCTAPTVASTNFFNQYFVRRSISTNVEETVLRHGVWPDGSEATHSHETSIRSLDECDEWRLRQCLGNCLASFLAERSPEMLVGLPLMLLDDDLLSRPVELVNRMMSMFGCPWDPPNPAHDEEEEGEYGNESDGSGEAEDQLALRPTRPAEDRTPLCAPGEDGVARDSLAKRDAKWWAKATGGIAAATLVAGPIGGGVAILSVGAIHKTEDELNKTLNEIGKLEFDTSHGKGKGGRSVTQGRGRSRTPPRSLRSAGAEGRGGEYGTRGADGGRERLHLQGASNGGEGGQLSVISTYESRSHAYGQNGDASGAEANSSEALVLASGAAGSVGAAAAASAKDEGEAGGAAGGEKKGEKKPVSFGNVATVVGLTAVGGPVGLAVGLGAVAGYRNMSPKQIDAAKKRAFSAVLGREDESIAYKAFTDIGAFLNTVLGSEPLEHDWIISLSLLSIYHSSKPPSLPPPPPRPYPCLLEELALNRLAVALRFSKFATAAYGSDLMGAAGMLDELRPEMKSLLKDKDAERRFVAERAAIAHHVGLTSMQIVHLAKPLSMTPGGRRASTDIGSDPRAEGGEGGGETRRERAGWEAVPSPRYFIAVDPSHRNIILAIRGTSEISDMLTDIMCRATPFCGGLAHEGVAAAARRLFAEVLPTMARLAKTYPDFSIVVCGHSLGAGVAMLVTMLIIEHQRTQPQTPLPQTPPLSSSYAKVPPRRVSVSEEQGDIPFASPVSCMAFAPPPAFAYTQRHWGDVVNAAAARSGFDGGLGTPVALAASAVTIAFVHGDDIIPRWGYRSALALSKQLRAIDKMAMPGFDRVSRLVHQGPKLREDTEKRVAEAIDDAGAAVLSSDDVRLLPALVIPASSVYAFFKPEPDGDGDLADGTYGADDEAVPSTSPVQRFSKVFGRKNSSQFGSRRGDSSDGANASGGSGSGSGSGGGVPNRLPFFMGQQLGRRTPADAFEPSRSYVARRCDDQKVLQDVKLSGRCITDHMPDCYERAIESALEAHPESASFISVDLHPHLARAEFRKQDSLSSYQVHAAAGGDGGGAGQTAFQGLFRDFGSGGRGSR